MIAEVVEVHPIDHQGRRCLRLRSQGCRQGCQEAVELPLAGVAAILRVSGVGRIVEFGGGNLPVVQAHPAGLQAGLLAQVRRQGR